MTQMMTEIPAIAHPKLIALARHPKQKIPNRIPPTRHLTLVFDNIRRNDSFRRITWLTTSFTLKNPSCKPAPT
jgi:hypothetical protein